MLPARSAQAGRRFVTSWLSGRTWLWNHEIGMARFDPGVFHFRDFFEPTDFVFVRPDDVVFARGRAARVDPPLFDPVMDRLLDDAELAGQVGNPPFVFLEQIVAKILTDQTHFPHQGADSYLAKAAAAVRWNRSEEHTSELQSLTNLVCRLLLEKKKYNNTTSGHTPTQSSR